MTTATKVPHRIDQLTPGTRVVLDFNGERDEAAKFMGLTGVGPERRAEFWSCSCPDPDCYGCDSKTYAWEAYRYRGGWAYGTSAQRLRLVEVL